MTVLAPLLLALLAAPAAVVAGYLRTRWAAPVGATFAAAAFAATLWGWFAGGGVLDLPWAPSFGLRLIFALDGLAVLYALLATGIGCAVTIYAASYIAAHLKHEGRRQRDQIRFFGFLLLFMGAMVGLVMSQDLVLLFLFWDLTTISSYYLIGYDRSHASARQAALMALLITGVAAVFYIVGVVMLYVQYSTFALADLIAQLEATPYTTTALGLMALAALAKCAQVPFHFWLPRAMAAPTPVSAYLHSAAMVAAGVFLLGRLYPLLQRSELLLNGLLAIGLLSMAIGGVLALSRDVLKQVLAYSTIAQYGYVVTMLGLGGKEGAAGASFYVIAHGLVKSSLFMTAGAVTEATGQDRLSKLGGLRRERPWLALISGVAAAALAGAPLTIGFWKDEVFFAAALHRGPVWALLAMLGAALTLAYVWHFWSGIFLGQLRAESHPVSSVLVVPIVVLTLLALLGGFVVAPFARVAEAAGAATLGEPTPLKLAYHLDARPVNLLALGTYTLGALIVLARPVWERAALGIARLGERVGPLYVYLSALRRLNDIGRMLLRFELRELRERVALVLVPTALLLGAGLLATPFALTMGRAGTLTWADLPLIVVLLLTAAAAGITTMPRRHLTLTLALSSVGYSLAAVYAFLGAPDVGLVMVLVETLLTVLLLASLALYPREALLQEAERTARRRQIWGDRLVGIIAGAGAFTVAWGVLSREIAPNSIMEELVELTPEVHAGDVVTAILADFRGLDTAVEISVIAVVLLGMVTLLASEGRRS